MIFRKFEMTPTQWEMIKPLIEKEETTPVDGFSRVWNAELIALVHKLPPICTEIGEDEEGRPMCVKFSPKIAVDIVWVNEVHEAFVPHLVWPSGIGKHSLGQTLDAEYMQARELHLASSNS